MDKTDQEELRGLTGARLEFSYLTDVTIDGKDKAVRLSFSTQKPSPLSADFWDDFRRKQDEVALAAFWKDSSPDWGSDKYPCKGRKSICSKDKKNYRIVGFIKSAEMWSEKTWDKLRVEVVP